MPQEFTPEQLMMMQQLASPQSTAEDREGDARMQFIQRLWENRAKNQGTQPPPPQPLDRPPLANPSALEPDLINPGAKGGPGTATPWPLMPQPGGGMLEISPAEAIKQLSRGMGQVPVGDINKMATPTGPGDPYANMAPPLKTPW